MTKEELLELVKLGEGLNVELKQSFSASVGKEICAFANTIGGYLIFGVDDRGKIIGITDFNRTKSLVQDIARNMDPPLSLDLKVVDDVLVAIVPKGTKKPYSVNGKFYVREAANSQQLNRDEIREFFYQEQLVYFDEKLCHEFNTEKDLSQSAYDIFLELSEIFTILPRNDLLNNLHLVKNNTFSNAAVLLLSRNVTQYFSSATITCVLFMGTTKFKILDKKELKRDLFSNYQEAIRYLFSHLNTEYIIKSGPREERLELPEVALREALLNAIAHREYRSTANIQICIFNDRVEITNPGGLVGGLKKEDLGRRSMPRNPLLFSIMERMGLVEQVGSGILRMQDGMKKYQLQDPIIETDENFFNITFIRKYQNNVPKNDFSRLSQLQWLILKHIKENSLITYEELETKLKKSRKTIRLSIKELKNMNLVDRIGSDKKGHWAIKTGESNE